MSKKKNKIQNSDMDKMKESTCVELDSQDTLEENCNHSEDTVCDTNENKVEDTLTEKESIKEIDTVELHKNEEKEHKPKPVICPYKGSVITLYNTPIYQNAISKVPMKRVSGKFYFYDDAIINRRVRITVHNNIESKNRNPSLILGYIDLM